ncbi:MAG: methionine biosynthesis protein MetW [Deltaproteobacteria bacterium]|nr:methionine biosynthesis protein MetW [Deltaproteobacteria bacterium]
MTTENGIRADHRMIFDIIEPGAKVLDLGCGNGDLMQILEQRKNARVRGIEVDLSSIYQCVEKGLSVCQGDIESSLEEYPDHAFDYVILNQSMQEIKNAHFLLVEALRVGARVIVGFPNFAHIGARISLFFKGQAPVTDALPYCWYNTPNVRFLSIRDFKAFCREKGFRIVGEYYLGAKKRRYLLPNLFALNGIFVITEAAKKGPQSP